ncbi:MAG: hypothetical protein ACK42D_03515 [Candidatus Paceibacteria bacterium]
MNILNLQTDIPKKMLTLFAVTALLVTTLPLGVKTATAARTGVDVSAVSATTVETNEQVRLQAQVQDDGDGGTNETAYVTLTDGGEGGVFFDANPTTCGNNEGEGPVTLTVASNTSNKNFCYSNATAGTYTISVQAATSTDVGSPATIQVIVEEPAQATLDNFPSTNSENRDANRPHVNFVSATPDSITLEFRNDTNSQAFFEIRTDGVVADSSRPLHYNPCKIGNEPLNSACNGLRYLSEDERYYAGGVSVDNRTNQGAAATSTVVMTFSATDTIEVRLALGGERSWDFNWVQFDVTEPPAPKPQTTVTVTGDTAGGENQAGWLFNRDVDYSTPFEFTTAQSSVGNGSLYVLPIGTNPNDKFIGELFINSLMSDIASISYDYRLGDTVSADSANQFYANVYANFDDSNDYGHCVYSIIPTVGTDGWHTMSFYPAANYDVRQRSSSPQTCPASPADMGEGAELRMFVLNLGDVTDSDMGIDGYFDNVVVETTDMITIYDFEQTAPVVSGGGGGTVLTGRGSSQTTTTPAPEGEVLGAATTTGTCGMYLEQYIGMNTMTASAWEIMKLQLFLLSRNLYVGNAGVYDAATEAEVRRYQANNASAILQPWVTAGLATTLPPTGKVYKTTRWHINNAICPGSESFPTLP